MRYKFYRIKTNPLLSAVLLFWSIYWLFNFLDKIFGGKKLNFWVGKNRIDQLTNLFNQIGVKNTISIATIFILITIIELIIFYFYHKGLLNILKNQEVKKPFLRGTVLSILLFTFFVAGDVVFGERGEVLEHTIYAILSLLSYTVFFNKPAKNID